MFFPSKFLDHSLFFDRVRSVSAYGNFLVLENCADLSFSDDVASRCFLFSKAF